MKKFFEKHDLIKMMLIAILFVFVLTWIIPSGTYQGADATGVLQRTGIADLSLSGMMSVSFFLQQIIFVAVVGAFYGVLTKMDGYKKLVDNVAKKMKGHAVPFVLVVTLIIATYTSITTNVMVSLIFIPFIISVIKRMELDDITTYATTFGAILIGILGATYGTEGLISFVGYLQYYATASIDIELAVRAGILLLAYILYSFFQITHIKKITSSKKKKEEEMEDIFAVEEPKAKKVKTWPVLVGGIVLIIFAILGYIDWQGNFGIEIFTNFHKWLTELAIGEHTIISYILGTNAAAFGSWQLYHIITIMSIVTIILAIIYRVGFNSIIDGIDEGVKKMIKPIGIITLVYVIFVIMYWSPIIPSIVSWIEGLTNGFNPFTSTLSASIAALFHSDFGYTGYVLGNLFANYEGNNFNIAFVIYSSMNGVISMFAPTSVIAMLGLSYCNIPYKKWFSYIWKFLVGIIVCLLVIFALLTYL